MVFPPFHPDKTVDFISEKFPHLYVGALGNKAAYEVAFQKLLLSAFYKVNYDKNRRTFC